MIYHLKRFIDKFNTTGTVMWSRLGIFVPWRWNLLWSTNTRLLVRSNFILRKKSFKYVGGIVINLNLWIMHLMIHFFLFWYVDTHICDLCGLNELFEKVSSNTILFEKMICHKIHICNLCCHHELCGCVSLNFLHEKMIFH